MMESFVRAAPGTRSCRKGIDMSNLSRRNFLQQSSAVAAGLGLLRATPQAGAAEVAAPKVNFPARPLERIAISTYAFRSYIAGPGDDGKPHGGMTLPEFAADVRQKLGAVAIEPWSEHLKGRDPHSLAQIRQGIEKAGSHVANLAVDEEGSYYDANPAARRAAVEARRRWVEVAVALGCPSIRTNMGGVRQPPPNVQVAADALRQVADHAGRHNIVLNLENDDPVGENPFILVQVIEKVNHPYLHALPDFCNSMRAGSAEDNYRGMQALFAHALSICHVKREEIGEQGQVYAIDLTRTFGILRSSGFRGYCSMEWEGKGSAYDATGELMAQTVKYLG